MKSEIYGLQIFMSQLVKSLRIVLFLMTLSISALAQWTGPTTTPYGVNTNYSYDNGVVYQVDSWIITNGSIVSSSSSGTIYSVTVNWTAPGSGTLSFKSRSTIISTLNVTACALPTLFTVGGGGSYCPGANGVNVTLSGSQTGTSYDILVNGVTKNNILTGTGGILTWTNNTPVGTYSIVATNSCGSSTMTGSVSVSLKSAPSDYTVSGGGGYCSGGSGVSIVLSGSQATTTYQLKVNSTNSGSAITGTGGTLTWTNQTTAGTYTVDATLTSTGCVKTMSGGATVTINSIPTAPAYSGNSRFGAGTFTLAGSGTPSGGSYKWYNASNVYQNTGLTFTTVSLSASATSYMYVSANSSAGCEGPKTAINVYVNAQPIITAPQNYVTKGITVTMDAGAGYDSYSWKNSSNAVVGSAQTYGTTLPDTYSVTVTKTGATSLPVTYTLNDQLYGVNMNYIVSNNVLLPGVTSSSQVPTLTADNVTQTIAYFDGLGRPMQNVATQASPLKGDIVSPIKYDQYGRQAYEYLPYVSENNGRYKSSDLASQATFYATTPPYNNKIKTDAAPWSFTDFEKSPLNRILQKGAPGTVWQPDIVTPASGKAIKLEYLVNVDGTIANTETVKKWTITPVTINTKTEYILSSSASYPSSALYVNVTKDEENRQVREYKDKLGKVILKKVQEAATAAIQTDANWTLIYYIYDEFERLRFVLQPKFIFRNTFYDGLATNDAKKGMLDSLSFEYRYDDRGRMIYKRVPGAKQVEMVYDQWDRLVLSQDGNQRAATKWSFTKYDVLNRPIITGEISSPNTRDAMVTAVNAIIPRNENTASGNGVGYSLNLTYPTTATINDIYTITYYDDYSFKTNLALGTAYDASIPAGFTGAAHNRVKNLVTGTKIRVLESSPLQWLVSATYYDDRYRVLQVVADDHLTNKNKITNEYYGLTPWVTKSQLNHGTALTSLTETTYDHMGRVNQVWQTMDAGTRTLIASHKYNELGQLYEKNIHSTDNGTTFLQSNDYRYNIRGWLTNINNSALSNDGMVNDDANDLFGMELKYNEIVSINGVNTKDQYNGNISAIQWKTNNLVDATTEKIYGFKYDPLNRLTDATYATKNGTLWNANVSLFDENLTYDKNGNIGTLKRKSLYNSSTNTLVDDLKYYYKGNQLDAVADNAAAGTIKTYGFNETSTLTTGEYTYDANGSMEVDQNKGIVGPSAPDPKGVLYNHLNLPREVRMGTGPKRIVYTYDAAGTKLRKVAYDNSGAQISRTEYVGGIQYESVQAVANPVLPTDLKFMMTSEGRTVKSGTNWNYEYFHKDHLGNTRVVYGYQKQVDEYLATMETQRATKEQAQFYNITTTRVSANNHTASSIDITAPVSSAETNGYIAGKAIGPAKMLQVSAGDRVQMEVFARYTASPGTNNTLITNLASAVTTTFQTVSGEAAFTALTNSVPVQAATITKTSSVPKAYLFYILFNSSYVYQQFGYVQISTAASTAHQQLYLDVTIPTGGYLYTYVADESKVSNATSVFFDDFKIIHTRSTSALQVVQTTDYYPFGLAMAAQSYQKQSSLDNDYLYNGKELQDEHNLGWMDYIDRAYDPVIGRFTSLDKRAINYMTYSPYGYVVNNPIRNVDINGQFILPSEFLQKYSSLANYLQNEIQGILENKRIVGALKEFGGFSDDQLKKAFTWGKGPVVNIQKMGGEYLEILGVSGGVKGATYMGINVDLVEELQSAKGMDRDYLLFLTAVTILHEYVHNGYVENELTAEGEEGNNFERKAYGEVVRYSTGNYKTILDQWLNRQKKKQEERRNKVQAVNSFISNFSSIESGTYTWEGNQFIKEGSENPDPENRNEN